MGGAGGASGGGGFGGDVKNVPLPLKLFDLFLDPCQPALEVGRTVRLGLKLLAETGDLVEHGFDFPPLPLVGDSLVRPAKHAMSSPGQ